MIQFAYAIAIFEEGVDRRVSNRVQLGYHAGPNGIIASGIVPNGRTQGLNLSASLMWNQLTCKWLGMSCKSWTVEVLIAVVVGSASPALLEKEPTSPTSTCAHTSLHPGFALDVVGNGASSMASHRTVQWTWQRLESFSRTRKMRRKL